MNRRTFLAAAAIVGTAFAINPALAQFKPLEGDPTTLNVGIISTESTQTLKDQWLPMLADMEKSLRMPVKAFFAPDYRSEE